MSFPYTPNLLEEKLDSLQTQHEFLKLLRLRHLQWMNTAGDSESAELHRRIAALIEQLIDPYSDLFEKLA